MSIVSGAKGVVVISGGSRGLGATLVNKFLESGFCVATFSRKKTNFVTAHEHNDQFFWTSVDCEDQVGLQSFLRDVSVRYGKITGLVNNAAVGADGILATMSSSQINKTVDINLKAQLFLTKLTIKQMLLAREGCIVNISSINAVRGHSGLSVYSATKSAMDGLTRSLAKELGKKNIRINSVSPGYFESDMVKDLSEETLNRIKRRTPLGRLGSLDEVSKLVMFLFTEGTFITGQNIVVDGGFTC